MKSLSIASLALVLALSGCSNGTNGVISSEVENKTTKLYGEERLQMKYCKAFEKANESLKADGMTYETRDLFSVAYDIVHEELYAYWNSRYRDYDRVMADHSWSWSEGDGVDTSSLDGIMSWCSEIKTKLG